jgi:hypothetical protein
VSCVLLQKVEMEIESGLRLMGKLFDADRCALMCHTSRGEQMGIHDSWISCRLDPRLDIFPPKTKSRLLHWIK